MRPIKLTMTAFGPYSGNQVIDFSELKERNLFLVTGPTGAGKTTIFDAISYALYGRTSGGLRTEETLRSHFAEKTLMTEVDLTFELKGTLYHVLRVPGQLRPKSRGEGLTEQKPEAVLTIEDGEPRTVITGVSKVTAKLEELLGINVEQFRQIMMIPQGEFRKLLTADSQEREKVLQQLFDTYLYRRIQNELNERAKSLGSHIKSQRVERDTLVTAIKCGDDEALQTLAEAEDKAIEVIIDRTKDLIKSDKKRHRELEGSLAALAEEIQTVVAARTKAEAGNRKLKDKALKDQALAVQEAAEAEILKKKSVILKAEKAAALRGPEDHLILREKQLKTRREELTAAREEEAKLRVRLDKANESLALQTTPEAEEARQKARRDIEALRGYVPKVSELAALKSRVETAKKGLETAEQGLRDNDSEKQRLKNRLKLQEEEVLAYRDTALRLEQNLRAFDEAEKRAGDISKAVEMVENHRSDQDRLDILLEKNAKMKRTAQASSRLYKEGKLTFLTSQAALLAKELEAGAACPVCGATDHPAPAQPPVTMVTEDDLEALEQQADFDAKKASESAKALAVWQERCLQGEKAVIDQLKAVLNEEGRDHLNKLDWGPALERAEIESKALYTVLNKERTKLTEEAERRSSLESDNKSIGEKLEKLDRSYHKLAAEKTEMISVVSALTASLEMVYKEVPEAYYEADALTKKISILQEEVRTMAENLEGARGHQKTVSDRYVALEAGKEQLTKAIEEDQGIYGDMKAAFEKQLRQAGFEDYGTYREAQLEAAVLEDMKAEQEAFYKELEGLRRLVTELAVETGEMKEMDLAVFDQKREALENQRKEATDKQGTLKARIEDNRSTIGKIDAINSRIRDREKVYKKVGQLARVAQGQNPQMMTFERYVLAAFLEDIVVAANSRLRQMTQGRYELSRSKALQRKNRQSGLELEVFDNFTGRSRHVKTLSGGESFKASLAMALGLSDVVQSYAGGVRLDTMFIDEGFGTLDQESLDSAINCLIDLQKSGRLVGIISHVQELKERIDTRLEITATNRGSKGAFVLG